MDKMTLERNKIICRMCDTNCIEDEIHSLIIRYLKVTNRNFQDIARIISDYHTINNNKIDVDYVQ